MKKLKSFIEEQLHNELCNIYYDINESDGLYNGQLELASFLTNDIEKYINDNKNINEIYKFENHYKYDDLKEFNNIFFNHLELIVNASKNMSLDALSNYHINSNENDLFKRYNYDKKNKRLNILTITINMPSNIEKYWEDIRGRISHELNHLYTYYNIICDDFNESDNLVPEQYFNILETWANSRYSKMTEHLYLQKSLYKDPNKYYNIVSNLLIYSLTRFERNAFLCEISSYLFDRRNIMKNVKSIENELEKCNQYNIYNKEFDIIYYKIKNEWTIDQQNILKDTYNKIYSTNKSFGKILKILKQKNEDTIKKLNLNIKDLVKKYKDIPMYTTSYPFESEITFENPIYKFNFF